MKNSAERSTASHVPTIVPRDHRRGFLAATAAVCIGGVLAVFPFLAGALTFFDPLRRKSDTGGFLKIANLDALPADGVPRRFTVLATRTDAWNRFTNEPIGAIYLRRLPGGEVVESLNSICPHAGCFVDFDAPSTCFKCPCHNSAFTVEGGIIQPSPSPRPMDALEVEVRPGKAGKELWVRFENFYTGIEEKLPKA